MHPNGKVITPFRYPGGKFYALKYLEPFWLAADHDEYREPFIGGGSVFFAKPKARFNWINDIDSDLIATYKVIQDSKLSKNVLKRLEKEEASKERWREIKNLKPNGKLETAFRYYYLNRTSFSGKMVSSAWGYRPKRSVPPHRWGEKILPSHHKLSDVKITSIDFEKVLTAQPRGEKVLMFLDPPYFNPPKKKHYVNGFGKSDHLRLRDILESTEYKFFLTYEDCEEVRELYKWANIYPIKFFYRVDNSNIYETKRRVGAELIIANYKLDHGFFKRTL
jgi:DNA adenine methylase